MKAHGEDILTMAAISAKKVYLDGDPTTGVWWLEISGTNGGIGFSTTILHPDLISDECFQALIDGDVHPELHRTCLDYDMEADLLLFDGPDAGDHEVSSRMAFARTLIAPALATALGLRQPANAGVKPAKA